MSQQTLIIYLKNPEFKEELKLLAKKIIPVSVIWFAIY
jgi:hypothetical protein